MKTAEVDLQQPGGFQSSREKSRVNYIRLACWVVLVSLALLELWSGRYYTDPDGISYLDMSDTFLRHNWHLLINPYWSPMYPFLLGVATWLLRPSAYWEFVVVHFVNFLVFFAMLAAFEILLREVMQLAAEKREDEEAGSIIPLPPWMWQMLGYSLFAWSAFVMINGIRKVSPDSLVATFVYLDAALLLRMRRRGLVLKLCLILGITLGLGYIAKAILFPMAFVFMVVALVLGYGLRKKTAPLALTLLVFVALAAPLFLNISRVVGRPSFGEVGSINYAWFVDGEEALHFYSALPARYLKHPIPLIHKNPNVFEFDEAMKPTYALWFDPAYWNAGVKPRFEVKGQLRVLSQSLTDFYAHLVLPMWGLIAGFLILLLMSPDLPFRLKDIAKAWVLILPGVVGLSLYALVLVQERYIAPFAVLIWLGLFSGIRIRKSQESARLGAVTTLVVAGSLMVLTLQFVVFHLVEPLHILQGRGGMYYRVAESLNKAGLQPGDSVAIIGSGWDGMFWARLARAQIVAQIIPEDADGFWRADSGTRADVFAAMARTGAKAVVTESAPPSAAAANWQWTGVEHYYVHFLASMGAHDGG